VRSELNLEFSLPARGEVRLELFDLAGRRLLTRRLGVLEAGRQQHALRLDDLPAGLLWIRLLQGDRRAIARAVIVR